MKDTKHDGKVKQVQEAFSKLKMNNKMNEIETSGDAKTIARHMARLETDLRGYKLKQTEIENRMVQMEETLQWSLSLLMQKLDAVLSEQKKSNFIGRPFPDNTAFPNRFPTNPFPCNPFPGNQLPINPLPGHQFPGFQFPGPQGFRWPSQAELLLDAAQRGDSATLLRLLAEDVDIQVRNNHGDTALHVAAAHGHHRDVRLLLVAGASVHAPGRRMRSALHCASANGHLLAAEVLLKSGAKVHDKDADGATALSLAAMGGHKAVVELLLRKGARPNTTDNKGLSPIFLATSGGHADVVQLLLENGVSVDTCDEGEPLLVHAAKSEQWGVVKLLLEKGSSFEATSTAAALAAAEEDPDESPLALASKSGAVEVLKDLLQRDKEYDEEHMESALNVAKNGEVVWALADAAPELLRGDQGKWGLLYAAEDGRLETLQALLEAGVDPNARDCAGITPLHVAAWNGHFACVLELLQRGADKDAQDEYGDTPLHKAALGGRVLCARYLLMAAASTTEVNKDGENAYEVAGSDAVRLLLDSIA